MLSAMVVEAAPLEEILCFFLEGTKIFVAGGYSSLGYKHNFGSEGSKQEGSPYLI